MTDSPLRRFQDLLRTLFQFDCADLDFGIYRILNHKRSVIEAFIEEKLPAAVEKALATGATARWEEAARNLEAARKRVVKQLGFAALRADGKLKEVFRETPVGTEYLEARRRAGPVRSAEAVAADTYNHLYAFFSRYYENGDFVSKRRYSKKHRYAIPYNGEEVVLHWANADQYYIKTTERFHDYDFRAPNGVRVRFELRAADVEQDNRKGDARFFVTRAKEIQWNGDDRRLTVPFEYRPLTPSERKRLGRATAKKKKETLSAEAARQIKRTARADRRALGAIQGPPPIGSKPTLLDHHLHQYTRRNTCDYFIHKDLEGFLGRELDFYLKNEFLDLDAVEGGNADGALVWLESARLIRSVGGEIIAFLAQIENFQKKLWEKRKFVLETQYCVTLDLVPDTLHAEIAANVAQREEWDRLFAIRELPADLLNGGGGGAERLTTEFLRANPNLVLDTRHFDEDFRDRLLAALSDTGSLDRLQDGLLVHGENFQALSLLQAGYAGRIPCVYIDPPYNTGNGDFLYKDSYRNSSWLCLMHDRMSLCFDLLRESGFFVSHIDEHELHDLQSLIAQRFGPGGNVGPIIWDKRNPKGDPNRIATQHEYVCWGVRGQLAADSLRRTKANALPILDKARELLSRHGRVDEAVRNRFRRWVRSQRFSGGEAAYREMDDEGRVFRLVSMAWPNRMEAPPEYFEPLIHPRTGRPCPVPKRGWRSPPSTMRQLLDAGEIVFGRDETSQPQRRYLLADHLTEKVPSLHAHGGSDDSLQRQFGYSFENAKPLAVAKYIVAIAASGDSDVVVDCFAGSGVAAHAVLDLNRQDGRRRRYLLVEMADHFDSVLLPRLKKAVYSPDWKNGKPVSRRGISQFFRYIRLESYEDALNNLEVDRETEQRGLPFPDYTIRYMLDWETKRSSTLLNVKHLERPFDYELAVRSDGETRRRKADLPETFHFLIGLRVRTRRVYHRDGQRVLVCRGKTRQRNETVVLWRDIAGWGLSDFEDERAWVREHKLTEGAETVYVNGQSVIPDAFSLDPDFKRLMFAPVTA